MRRSPLLDPLRRRPFRRLAASYTVNQMGDWMGIVALSVLVFDRTGSAMATAVLFIGTRFLPALLAPILVVRIEQPPPRFALPLVYCGEAAAFGGLALLAGKDFALAAVVALAAIDGTLALAGRALTRAVVTELLEPAGELRAGNSVLNVAFTGGAAIGPAVAGLLVAGFGVQSALLLDAASFYVVAVILFTAGTLPQAAPDPGLVGDRIRAGIAYIRGTTTLRRLLAAQGIALVFFSAAIPIEIVYAKDTLGTGAGGYGLLLASWGSGMVLGRRRLRGGAARLAGDPLLHQHDRRRRRLHRPGRRAHPGARLRGRRLRRHRQRRAVGDGRERRAGDDRCLDAGQGDERAGVDRGGDASHRLPPRWPARNRDDGPDDPAHRRPGRAGDRLSVRSGPGQELAWEQ